MPIPWGRIGALVVLASLLSTFMWRSGAESVQADWDRAENIALEAQIRLREIAEDERDVANDLALESQIKLESEELNSARAENVLQDYINREKVTTTISVSTSDDCPIVRCAIVNPAQHFRLFNCGISNTSCETISDAGETDISDGAVQTSNVLTFVDGIYGRVNRDFSFRMGAADTENHSAER